MANVDILSDRDGIPAAARKEDRRLYERPAAGLSESVMTRRPDPMPLQEPLRKMLRSLRPSPVKSDRVQVFPETLGLVISDPFEGSGDPVVRPRRQAHVYDRPQCFGEIGITWTEDPPSFALYLGAWPLQEREQPHA
jgi:hypothetical protein